MATKFRVVLIEEGLGNFGDMFYYTRAALQGAADEGIFEGAKCFADHPDAIQERVRPERSVRDIIGHFESVHVENGATGEALLVGDLSLLDDPTLSWAVTMVETACNYAGKFGKDFVGLSINASGESQKNAIAEFLKSGTIPESALPKLKKAIDLGNAEIEICTRLIEAVSCDLVTEAGAKGRILKMLEGARLMAKPAKKTVKETVKRAKEDGAGGSPGDSGAAAPKHDDEEQDKELIKSMLDKYVGKAADGEDHPAEAYQAMKLAHEHAKEAGLEGEEAEKGAGYAVKLAMHAAKKQAEKKETEGEESEESEKESEGEESENEDEQDDEKPSATGGASNVSGLPGKKKESEIIKLRGKVASLEERLAKKERDEELVKALAESGLPIEARKKFRESVKEADTKDSVLAKLDLFKEGFAQAGGETVYHNPEKSELTGEKGLSFADCVKE